MPAARSLTSSRPVLRPRIRASIRRIASAHGARNVRLFGSFVRGEQRPQSDLDLLVDMPADSSLLDVSRLTCELEELLGRKVDVVPEATLKPALRERILAEARPV